MPSIRFVGLWVSKRGEDGLRLWLGGEVELGRLASFLVGFKHPSRPSTPIHTHQDQALLSTTMPSSQIPSTSRASRSGTRAMRDPSPANPPVQAPAPSRPSALSPPPMYSAARPHSAPPQTDSTSSSARPSIPDVKLFFAPFAQYEDGVMAQIEVSSTCPLYLCLPSSTLRPS